MRNVTVSQIHFLIILHPFHDGTRSGADPGGHQPALTFGNLPHQLSDIFHVGNITTLRNLFSQCFPRFHAAGEKFSENLVVHGCSYTARPHLSVGQAVTVFRRYGRICDQIPVRFRQEIHKKQRRFRHNGKSPLQKVYVLCILIMHPEMSAQPRAPQSPVSAGIPNILRRCISMDVRIVMRCKAPASVHFSGCPSAVFSHLIQQFEQRQMAFRQITAFHMPIIHFRIDINCILTVPRREKIFIP